MIRVLLVAWAAGCAALSLPGLARLRAPVALRARAAMVLDDADTEEACLLLPHNPFAGASPALVGGEMMLQELEDDADTRTQIFLNADGTVSHGATDGPPPLDMCGLWQCGEEGFQMTIQRTFTNSAAVLPEGVKDENAYTVTRIYVGSVNAESSGVSIAEGRIDFFDSGPDDDELATSNAQPWKEEVLERASPPIGYFVLDGNTYASDQE